MMIRYCTPLLAASMTKPRAMNFILIILIIVLTSTTVSSFTPSAAFGPLHRQSNKNIDHDSTTATATTATTTTQLGLLGGLFGGSKESSSSSSLPPTVMEIPAKDVKIGALRFLLQIHLVGIQNEPQPNSWLTKQGTQDGELNIYYGDGTGMLSLQLQEYGIKAVRYGEKPSLQYMLQESVLLHSILDELQKVAFEVEDIDQEKRLLRLKDEGAIDKAREKLPARKS